MGCEAKVVVAAEEAQSAEAIVDDLVVLLGDREQRWSRFVDRSEICRLARRGGMPTEVSPPTYALLELAAAGAAFTGGWFDPMMGVELAAAGYDRSFETLERPHGDSPSSGESRRVGSRAAAPRSSRPRIALDPDGVVRVPAGAVFDPGGVGKGRAADEAVAFARAAGATGVFVDLSGDVAVWGTAPDLPLWIVGVESPFEAHRLVSLVALDAGAVATSSVTSRRWHDAGEDRHHLLDPRTGRPAIGTPASVTVIAAACGWAEMLAKSVLLAPGDEGEEMILRAGAAALVQHADGTVDRLGSWSAFEARGASEDRPTGAIA